MMTLAEMAVDVLTTSDAKEKTRKSLAHAAYWVSARKDGIGIEIGTAEPPQKPARPVKPDLLSPRDVPA